MHSGTDLVAALLTLFAVGVAVRPADVSHQYGHGKAEHLSALAEATILVAASCFIAWRAITHLVREHMFDFRPEWSDPALRRWLRRVGPESVADLFDLRIADVLGNGLKQGFPPQLETLRARIQSLRRTRELRSIVITSTRPSEGKTSVTLGTARAPVSILKKSLI